MAVNAVGGLCRAEFRSPQNSPPLNRQYRQSVEDNFLFDAITAYCPEGFQELAGKSRLRAWVGSRRPDNGGMEQQHSLETRRGDPGPGRDRFERGYCVLSKRTWERIRIEFSAGASVAWLSARYGAAERTIAQHAKKGGWRRKDLALKADALLEAEDAAALRAAEALAAREAEKAREREGAKAAARAMAGMARGSVGEDGPDLILAARRARVAAVAAMEKNPRMAQDYLKLARMLEGADDEGEMEDRPSPQDEAAVAFLLERLGYEE